MSWAWRGDNTKVEGGAHSGPQAILWQTPQMKTRVPSKSRHRIPATNQPIANAGKWNQNSKTLKHLLRVAHLHGIRPWCPWIRALTSYLLQTWASSRSCLIRKAPFSHAMKRTRNFGLAWSKAFIFTKIRHSWLAQSMLEVVFSQTTSIYRASTISIVLQPPMTWKPNESTFMTRLRNLYTTKLETVTLNSLSIPNP